jgi:hypothetical protein
LSAKLKRRDKQHKGNFFLITHLDRGDNLLTQELAELCVELSPLRFGPRRRSIDRVCDVSCINLKEKPK